MIEDTGKHYRKEFRGIKLDPARIAMVYGMTSPMLFTVLKKILRAGNGGHKSYRQDILDCQNALTRELEIIDENEEFQYPIVIENENEIDINKDTLWGM